MNPDGPADEAQLSEQRRVQRLLRLGVLDTPPEAAFDALAALAAEIFDAPIAQVSLLDERRQWIKAGVGTPGLAEIDKAASFCVHTIGSAATLVVPDALSDERFRLNPFVTGDPHVRFYAGSPIRMPGGEMVGTVCVVDSRPRTLSPGRVKVLESLARLAGETLLDRERALNSADVATRDELRRSALRLQRALEGSQLALWDLDLTDGTLYLSENWSLMLGGSPAPITTTFEQMAELVPPEDQQRIVERMMGALRGEAGRYDVEHRVRTVDGGEIWIHSRGQVDQRDASGRALHATGTNQDITARKRSEENVLRAAAMTRATLESTADGILVVGSDRNVVFHNQQFVRIWSVEPESNEGDDRNLLQRALARLKHPQAFLDRVIELYDQPDAESFDVLEFIDGRQIERYSRPMYLGGEPLGRVWSFRDVTERKAAEAQIERAKLAAEAASQAKTDFLATVSHEIRTPLNGVLGVARLLVSERLTPLQRQYAELIDASAQSLLGLINDLLDLGKIESGHVHLESVAFDLPALVQEVCGLHAMRAREKRLIMRTTLAQECPQWITGDPIRLRQVLGNLLANAIKFTDAGQVGLAVEVMHVHRDSTLLRFVVHDTGIGISADVQPLLFNRFVQGDNSTTRRYGGTGLGLAIVRQLCELMGGEVTLASAPGRGATFSCTLPFGLAQAPLARAPARERGAEPVERTARILVAEDNATNQIVLSGLLAQLGYRDVTLTHHGQEAVERAMRERFDVVLMDCNMPVLDGYDATQRLRAQGCATPIIAMTANATQAERERCHDAGMNDFLAKPLERETLLAAIERWLALSPALPAPSDASGATDSVTAASSAAFDRAAVLERLGEDDDLMRMIVSSFVEEFPATLDALRAALAQSDATTARRHLHSLSGSAATVGAVQIAREARRLENALVAGDLAAVEAGIAGMELHLGDFMVAALT